MSSIRARLLTWILATLAFGALWMGVGAYRNVLHETEALFDYQLRQMALSLRDQGEIAPAQASALADADFDFVVQIWSVDGRAIYASRKHDELPARVVLGFADVAVGGKTWRSFSVATTGRVIQVAQPLQIRKRFAAEAALRSVMPLLAVAPLMALAVWWLVTIAFKPLQRVASGVRARDAESLAPLPLADLPDEVTPLVQALNALLQRLDASFGAQRAFVSDAAHELRSPLTALRLQIGRLRRSADASEREAALDALAAGVERATRLVEQLLTLARSEPGARQAALETVDLGELVRQALADTVPFAASRGTELELDAQDGVTLQGDRVALAALARNLADNAVRYSPPGSRVQVGVAIDGGSPLLRVDDAGPGIPAADRERVFDRFYRRQVDDVGDGDGEAAQGTGLGLAIVKTVGARHGARVTLTDSPLGGLRVEVRFAPAG
ncbi:MAG: sensor histidine kinase N-terminal domain-containing protein [Burkholderiaceae bacterium]|nr:sensor histidine kinase N-terminal domain-containing protein [Burkholderiaceae bacterium]